MKNQKFSPRPPSLLQPPPGSTCQDILLLFAPLLACRIAKGGGTSFLVPLISSPPPILHTIHSHPSHLIPTIHQNCPLKVFNVHSFSHLSVQAAFMYTCHFHCKIHILSPIVMMDAVKFKDRFVFILCFSVGQMLYSS